jgi:AAHS family 4-hydroxybenzoate transporter-like MFS transporter
LLVGTAVFFAGFFISGFTGWRECARRKLLSDCRATGVSWANGVGRTGSILGSMDGGTLLAMNLSLLTIFLIVGLPALIGGASMFVFGRYRAAPPTGLAGLSEDTNPAKRPYAPQC